MSGGAGESASASRSRKNLAPEFGGTNGARPPRWLACISIRRFRRWFREEEQTRSCTCKDPIRPCACWCRIELQGVLRFMRGDARICSLRVARRKFRARLSVEAAQHRRFFISGRGSCRSPEPASARRYLAAAEPLAPKEWSTRIERATPTELDAASARHEKVSREMQEMAVRRPSQAISRRCSKRLALHCNRFARAADVRERS